MNIGISKRRRSSGTSTSSQTAKKNLLRNIVVGREQTGKSSFSRDVLAFGSSNSQGHGVSAFDGRSTRAINVFVAENTKTKIAANETHHHKATCAHYKQSSRECSLCSLGPGDQQQTRKWR